MRNVSFKKSMDICLCRVALVLLLLSPAAVDFSVANPLQSRTVSGTVVSEADGEPLIGVSVYLKGNEGRGVITDLDGRYSLTVPSGATLVFSYVGYVSQEIEVKGSQLDLEYDKLKKLFKEKYEGPLEPIDKNIQKLMAKEKRTANDEVMLGVFMLQRQRYIKARANYVRDLIKANPTQELSLILLQDELQDSTDLQKRLFKTIKVVNKESNLYKTVAEKMQ